MKFKAHVWMVCDEHAHGRWSMMEFAYWRWLIQWLLARYFSFGCWSFLDSLVDVLHDGHNEMVAYVENTLFWKSVL